MDNLHFADFNEATDTLAEPADNVATAVNIALGFLRDRNSTPIQKGEALSYLIHCVGDAHQPLHTGYIEDLGGNHIAIQNWADRRASMRHGTRDSSRQQSTM